ncbi:MAG: hypothetical protein A3J27_04055 [Candidatus Tectomicrobia bacterium RIFCSPLOWO2_12_FULL_69_37]|nr:MAG: hypothetical protein A3I72_01520 [Candidatus Tectomicrobia bacterium RIFCSPLOWO2_02_FULL_70_19]OGL67342.1 MAG: hypothetical protein A3J27_04055 [Candidatus Tectomicrobia bacterium RIFCSPLOWO2_12_FULL_69_37]
MTELSDDTILWLCNFRISIRRYLLCGRKFELVVSCVFECMILHFKFGLDYAKKLGSEAV